MSNPYRDKDTPSGLERGDLKGEAYREYCFGPSDDRTTYRIMEPQEVYWRPGGSTHRVLDGDGVVHLVPAPGFNGCVVRYAVMQGYRFVSW